MKKNISIVLLSIIVIMLCVIIVKKDKEEPKVEVATEEVATPEPTLTPEQEYQEWIESCFATDGTCPALIKLVKENVNDPNSVVSYKTAYKEEHNIDYVYDGITVVMDFGAANKMGGMVRAQVTAELNYNKGTIEIVKWDE